MTKKTIQIMLVDDHLLFREGMASLLQRDERFEILSEADDGISALEIVEEAMPDIILMDVKMPRMNGIEATRKLLGKYPDLKVIMITASEKDEDLFEAVKAGAQGYILKTVTDSQYMRDAIWRVAEGEAIIPPAMAPRLLNEFSTLSKGKFVKKKEKKEPIEEIIEEKEISLLTPRENEVLELVAQGLSNKEIAKGLVISVNTVRSHLRFILDKLHMNNRVQAALWYQEKKTP
ncbi:MAG: response regulator transcription factor [Anaerolineae bacterium]|jgi:DNA-binding NarL/FixJ family response regulator|nr:response regulator transcription factor [Anaerolineae bacterium]MBT3712025.1 response regulator transcription factor [Anaerolineae bacterium]MBT4309301.1 response regulator transcription factor [Anaerolineae bacterium]MBT4460124.1 response regulator transcription factor [Anaerolineae bacterium]MBT4842989.1 response regulator transcription factor [Anaerolineae bacterium]